MTYSNESFGYNSCDRDNEQDDCAYGVKAFKQGNFEDSYQENIYDCSNLADSAWTDTAANPNPLFQEPELELGDWHDS
jgi:hypothetical protein